MPAASVSHPSRAGAPAWAWLTAALVAGVAFLATGNELADNVIYDGVGAASLAVAAVGLRRRCGRIPRSWTLVLGGAATWLLGDLLWTAVELTGHEVPFPSPIDAIYLAGYPLMAAGVVVAWRERTLRPLGGLLDAAIVALPGGLFVWATVLDGDGASLTSLSTVTALAYPTLDLAVLAGIAQLLALPPLGRLSSLRALTLAVVVFFVSDAIYAAEALRGTYVAGGWSDIGWYGCYALLGFAGLHPDAAELQRAPARIVPMTTQRLLGLGAVCLLAPAALAIQVERGEFDAYGFVAAGSLLVAFVFCRMALLFREQQRADEELRESGELYRALVEQSGDMVALLGTDDRLVYASAAHEAALGYTPQEMLELRSVDLVHPEDRERAAASLERALAGHGGEGARIRLRRKDGAWIWADVRGTAIRGRDGTPLILLSSRDVTSRQEAEHALRQTTRKLQTLVDTAPAAIVGADAEGCVTLWNPAAEALFGWRAEEVLGAPTPLLSAEELEATMSEILAGRTVAGEQTRPRKDGTRVDVIASAAPISAEDGSVSALFAVFVDVSERNRLEEQLRQAQRLEAIGQLAGGIAHDFNNLLTGISGYQELALRRANGDDALRRQLTGIGEAAGRATELTRQLLAFGRRQLLQPTVFDLNETVARTQSLLQRVLGGNIAVATALEPLGCPVRADRGQVEQVLMNLAVNARDAMPDGGTLTLETARDDGFVRLRVADTGCGMDAETLGHAFEPFFTTKEQGKGTGLGLSTVYGIVTQSGGTVSARSDEGLGTCLEVLLPLSREAPAAPAAREPAPAEGSERVLLVEDEPIVRELTREMLEEHGYAVVCAERAEQALELADRERVDLLLTDVVMPGMNGRVLAARLRDERPDLRVLYTSGYSDDAALQGGTLEPLASFLQKPYSAGELGAAVRRMLDAAA